MYVRICLVCLFLFACILLVKTSIQIMIEKKKVCRENNKFITSVFKKPASRGVFTNFDSFIPIILVKNVMVKKCHNITNCAKSPQLDTVVSFKILI